MEVCYVVTCKNRCYNNESVSGVCYHNYENAIRFIENRSDNPKRVDERNPLVWRGNDYVYKIHPLSFGDEEVKK